MSEALAPLPFTAFADPMTVANEVVLAKAIAEMHDRHNVIDFDVYVYNDVVMLEWSTR